MSLDRGTKLGPYEVLEPIGAGGMGEVYRAGDPRMGREVAIKISAERFSDRFDREVRAVAALNHANICHLYDVGPNYLVMELVKGPTLAERIQQGPLPLEEALGYAHQIADALEAAHEKGIVHRDLKPANIKITPDSRVKVLDFGLAAMMQGAASAGAASSANSPTLTISPTRAGMILGTAAYMSPEQARGAAVDQRADIWAFGLVLYEMLAGRPAFAGETVTDILASVMKEQPDLDAVPPQVRPALARCLSKDRRARWGSIGDVRWALEAGQTFGPPVSAQGKGPGRWPWIISAACAVIALAAIWGWWRLESSPEPPRTVTRSAMTSGTTFLFPALSRDGTRLAYTEVALPYRIWLRMMDQLEGHPIPGSEGGIPAFSPDGQWIAYVKVPGPYLLKKIPVTGGTSITLCDVPGLADLFWGDDDSILLGSARGLMRVPAAGGRPESLTTPDAKNGETAHVQPELLPGGQAILFTIRTGPSLDAGRIAVLDLKTHTWHAIVNAGWAARYVPTGHLVYRRGAALFAVPFDVKRLAVTGAEAPVVEGIASPAVSGIEYPIQYAFSSTGLLVFLSGRGSGVVRTIAWMDRKGEVQALPEPPHYWGHFRLSPDGRKLAGNIQGDAAGVNTRTWIYDLERGILTPLTPGDGNDNGAAWTHDGKYITYGSRRGDKFGIYRIPADSSGPPEMLVSTESQPIPYCWTPDGKTLVYRQPEQGKAQIWVLSPAVSGGDGKPRRFHPEATSTEDQPAISPDGKWLAYTSDQSGRYEIYVSPFPGPGGKFQVSTQGGRLPVWSRNGRELLYAELNPRRLMAVAIAPGPSFQAVRPQPLFNIRNDSGQAGYDVSPDGKRFLVGRPPESAAGSAPQTTFIAVTDWFTDLLRRVPVKR